MALLKAAESVLWGIPMMLTFLAVGLYFTWYLRAFYLRKPKLVLKQLHRALREKGTLPDSMTPMQSVCTALSATVGTGNIAGVALALQIGGPGILPWMWLSAILGMATTCSENVLGALYRKRKADGSWLGGPMYYSKEGLHALLLSWLFAFFCLLSSLCVGCFVQSNSIAAGLQSEFYLSPPLTGLLLASVTAAVILGGRKRIGRAVERLVPGMLAIYLCSGLLCIALHFRALPGTMLLLFRCAFSARAVISGGSFTILNALRHGFSCGIFSNEAGLGSSVLANAASGLSSPAAHGLLGIFEVGVDTLLVCTITALVILTSGVLDAPLSGAALTAAAWSQSFGTLGGRLVAISLILFAFTTVLGWCHYGACAVEFIFGPRLLGVYRVLFLICIALGSVMNTGLAWCLANICNGMMALPNLLTIVFLRREVRTSLDAFLRRSD